MQYRDRCKCPTHFQHRHLLAPSFADTALQSGIDANASAISAEETARIAADTALQGGVDANANAISSEQTARQNADTALQGGVDANAAAILAEQTARQNADTTQQAAIEANENAISAEETARTAADTAQQAGIDANASAISAEQAARTAADTALQDALALKVAQSAFDTAIAQINTTLGTKITIADVTAQHINDVVSAAECSVVRPMANKMWDCLEKVAVVSPTGHTIQFPVR